MSPDERSEQRRPLWRGAAGRRAATALDPTLLLELRAALAAGASVSAAVSVVATSGPLAPLARDVRLGRSLAEAAADVDTGDPAADLLVRALAVVERTGTGAGAAVAQALTAIRDEAALCRLLRVRTAQARATGAVLCALPLLAWVLLVAVDGTALRFYANPLGALTAVTAVALCAGSWAVVRHLVRRAAAAASADPLAGGRTAPDWARAAVGLPVLVAAGVVAGPLVGIAAGVAAAAVAVRRSRADGSRAAAASAGAGGTAEAGELLAIALEAGLPPAAALEVAGAAAPPLAAPHLATVARRLRAGWDLAGAFEGSALQRLGAALAASERWGAPAADTIRDLAAELRAERRAAAEEAAERLQVALVFPTTLLTLPGFVLAVVPPLLWTALAGAGGVGLP